MKHIVLTAIFALGLGASSLAQKKEDKAPPASKLAQANLGGLKFRAVGPALTSGRVGDIAVNPNNPFEYYVAVASGGVWKTVNGGTTYEPIFDSEGSYSIGCVAIAPSNPHVIWVGTGENNVQRSVAYGDGLYRSKDGGKSWENMGLKESEHIGKILIHPTDPNIVYVAAQGPLWRAGGDRGLYKTTDGGKTWKSLITVSENTGVTDIAFDPRDPKVIYAATWQRRRHEFTLISGGPESALYKSNDGGETWEKLANGLPSGVDIGRIGLAVSPANPDYVYAIVEAADAKGGFFRSTDRGGSWEKRSGFATSGNYYQEIIADPKDEDKVYAMDTWSQVTDDGGKTFRRFGDRNKHVDHHAIWIDPNNTRHFLIGCDGGLYETYDDGASWLYKPNLSVTQFYRVAVDNATPFYNIYGGTQDNFSLGGPSRTTNAAGIVNADWFVTNGGDGFESQIDPRNPDIVYAQSQYGGLVRFDKKSGEITPIQPQPASDEPAYRWNWDSPLLISPHSPTRLYFAAQKLFKSDDRGNTWVAVSADLSRQIDRNKLPVMGKVWGMDAVAKNASTSIYGNIVALDESAKKEGLLYVGTDDGLVQVSEDGGGNWRKQESFSGVPDQTYVNCLLASQHDEQVVYAAFNNHKNGDFKPYLLKSTDKGKSWQPIANNLPARGSVYSIAEDHVNANLLFVGTEFGVFFTNNGGKEWKQLKAGLPTIAIRDIAIQKRENDLVLASFGRGFFVLDDYSPLREVTDETLAKEAYFFPTKEAWMFMESSPLGSRGKGFMGDAYFTAENPPIGTTLSFYWKENIKTLKEQRKEAEKALSEAGKPISYPSFEAMRAEDSEEKPYLVLTIMDEAGNVVRRLKTDAAAGLKRLVWDFRYATTAPVSLKEQDLSNPFESADLGYWALPGNYKASLQKVVNGIPTEVAQSQVFTIKMLNNATLSAADRKEVVAFQAKVSELRRVIWSANTVREGMQERIKYLKNAVMNTPKASTDLLADLRKLEERINAVKIQMNGDASVARREFEVAPSIIDRVENIVYGLWNTTTTPTTTQIRDYETAAKLFTPVLQEIKQLSETELRNIEKQLEQQGAPWTPGRILNWNRE